MARKTYRAVPIEKVTSALLAGLVAGASKLVVAIDVANQSGGVGLISGTTPRWRTATMLPLSVLESDLSKGRLVMLDVARAKPLVAPQNPIRPAARV